MIKKLKNPYIIRTALAIVLFGLILFGVLFTLKKMGKVAVENSLITAPITSISPSLGGPIKKIFVSEGQKVNKGDALGQVGTETLYAYTSGIIISVNKQLGATATVQTPVVQMVNPDDMRVDGTLDENKGLNEVKVGQIVSFTVDALPGKTFWGYVDEVSQTAKQTQAAFSISSERPTQQFDIYANFDANKYPEIKNGMSAKMNVFTKTH